ncbi:MAG: hypothetical protein QNI97_07120, partial [Desulfobacterales bacterium]|nr:hypothetical protein [Desulfobacterales bacterium]
RIDDITLIHRVSPLSLVKIRIKRPERYPPASILSSELPPPTIFQNDDHGYKMALPGKKPL